eukprot:TRINITY_DN12347_c1_g2_i8.p1 TRINITY_DN12347_c1_g2~~TRINITY_DN12347_c1_g2_i8.p1  ORF type:complete len:546 (+),score=94.91 TRINITY_DN12347_c1_g2_i8:108-1745(+)
MAYVEEQDLLINQDGTANDGELIEELEIGRVNVQVIEIPKEITVWNATSFIIGTMIGSGIFASPGSVLLDSKSVGMSLLAWVIAGIVALMGSACYAELGTLLPANGAEYTYIREGLSPLMAFLFTWTSSVVTRPGSQAIMIIIAGEYFAQLFFTNAPEWTTKGLAIGLNTIVLLINCRDNRYGTRLQDSTTFVKLLALVIIAIIGFVTLSRDGGKADTPVQNNLRPSNAFPAQVVSIGHFGLAVVGALFGYDGWNNANFIVAEMKNPSRDLPRALLMGIPLVVAVYILANIAYFAVLETGDIVNFDTGVINEGFAGRFGQAALGEAGKIILPLMIFASAFGATNGSLYTAARLVRESAHKGHFPRFLGDLWQWGRTPTPVPALLSQYLISTLLVVGSDFEALVEYFSASAWVFYFCAVFSLLRLRYTQPNAKRPFRVPTMIPILFLAIACCLVLSLVILAPLNSLISLGFIVIGVPVSVHGLQASVCDDGGTMTSQLYYCRDWMTRNTAWFKFEERSLGTNATVTFSRHLSMSESESDGDWDSSL